MIFCNYEHILCQSLNLSNFENSHEELVLHLDKHSFSLFRVLLVIFLLLAFLIVLIIDDLITFIKVNLSPKLLVPIKHVGLLSLSIFVNQGFGEAVDELTALVESNFAFVVFLLGIEQFKETRCIQIGTSEL